MLKVVGLVGLFTVISKVFGLVRDLVVAHYFGTSVWSDAFNMAFLFTGNLFVLFGGIGGPFYNAIIAILPKVKREDLLKFSFNTLSKTTAVLTLITIILYVFKAQLLSIFIDSETQSEYFRITQNYLNFLLPLIIICGPIGIIFAILNYYKYYFAPSISPALISISLIITVSIMGTKQDGISLALGTLIGGLLSLILQIPALFAIYFTESKALNSIQKYYQEFINKIKQLFKELPTLAKSDNNLEYQKLLFPALATTFISQSMVYVDSFSCSYLEEGSWTAVVMANRLIQMPLGVLLTAFLVPVYPKLAELAKHNNLDAMRKESRRTLGLLILLCIPAIIIGMLFSEPIIRLLFERGEFDARSTVMVSMVFFYLCISILPYVIKESISRIFYIFSDSKTPLYITTLMIIAKIIANHFLVQELGLAGIPLATVLVSFSGSIALLWLLKRKVGSFVLF